MEYYVAINGTEDKGGAVLFEDDEGLLFTSFRDASEYLINKKELEPYYDENYSLFGDDGLRFGYVDEEGFIHYGYVKEMRVIE